LRKEEQPEFEGHVTLMLLGVPVQGSKDEAHEMRQQADRCSVQYYGLVWSPEVSADSAGGSIAWEFNQQTSL